MSKESVVVSRLRMALHESQLEVCETREELAQIKAAYESLLLQVAPMRLLARTTDWVETLATREDEDDSEIDRAVATQMQALDFYRSSMDPERLADISRHLDRVVSLRAASILEESGDPRHRAAASTLKAHAAYKRTHEGAIKPQSVRVFG